MFQTIYLSAIELGTSNLVSPDHTSELSKTAKRCTPIDGHLGPRECSSTPTRGREGGHMLLWGSRHPLFIFQQSGQAGGFHGLTFTLRANHGRCWTGPRWTSIQFAALLARDDRGHCRAVLRDEGHSHDVKQNYWHNELLLSGPPHATIWRSLTAEGGHSEERRATGDHHRGRDDHFCLLQGDAFSQCPSWTC